VLPLYYSLNLKPASKNTKIPSWISFLDFWNV